MPIACRLVLAVAISALCTAIVPAWASAEEPLSAIDRGRELFVRVWKPYDELSPNGDGLGPMSNAESCADCHSQAGVGGGGELEHNVDLLCLVPPERNIRLDRVKRQEFVEGIRKIHPGLAAAGGLTVLPAITLHKFGENPAYEKWRIAMVMLVDHLPPGTVSDRIGLRLAARSTPALFGAGLIDSIPRQVLEETSRLQARLASGVRGRLAPATDGGVGKFGWRGQTSSLKEFVLGACANELGLVVPTKTQPLDPLDPIHQSAGLDLLEAQCNDLVAYVSSLPPPDERQPESETEKMRWAEGARVFQRVGCAECHVPKLGDVAGIYSDLLLHDMGPRLADPAAANSPGQPLPSPGSSGQYYGGPEDVFAKVPPETLRQWRTPPLWGVADSAPYLHDGRASTLDDAILQHAGEGSRAKHRYATLSLVRRSQLLAYLESLGQPAP